MSRLENVLAGLTVALAVGIAVCFGVTNVGQADGGDDPEDWVYESVVENGQLQFRTFYDWAGSQTQDYRPLSLFVRDKLGCKPPIDSVGWAEDLSDDWFNRMTGGPIGMSWIDGRYVAAESHMYKEAGSRGLLILDVENRWAAFAMTHSEDHWNYVDGGERGYEFYDEAKQRNMPHYYFSLFFVDSTSTAFIDDAKRIARMWVEGYGFGGKEGLGKDSEFRYYPDEMPMNVYEVRCSDAE